MGIRWGHVFGKDAESEEPWDIQGGCQEAVGYAGLGLRREIWAAVSTEAVAAARVQESIMRVRRVPGGIPQALDTADQHSFQAAHVPACFGTGAPSARVWSWQELSEGCAHSGSRRRNLCFHSSVFTAPVLGAPLLSSNTPLAPLSTSKLVQDPQSPNTLATPNSLPPPSPPQRKWH